ncbi:hypothetical protein TWF225_003311 [Orbilia oligospora]|uniref:Uncharacterized protein n=1 Tax=Orbilia oligospora TaxID=2813651 RepID=A0A7C8KBF4_ORBOL|nr:hypothetical protein TWF102_011317 [Orbilia oligospora]KAF3156922.1 hypothetical protein TWF751_002498 [Orbilia oligospora]KAF3188941.1 hypothetical protein TWF225_003311 [Orbilia oligospora]KAF3240323.1 hypothetical protein TWF128_011345 [Orbilia oligospora]KAF3240324.1 hypothetical protein TWF128_011345 [Orbilia oligospora]
MNRTTAKKYQRMASRATAINHQASCRANQADVRRIAQDIRVYGASASNTGTGLVGGAVGIPESRSSLSV